MRSRTSSNDLEATHRLETTGSEDATGPTDTSPEGSTDDDGRRTTVGGERTNPLDGCPECNGRVLTDRKRGELVCRDCGLVLDGTVLDRRPPRNDPTESATRIGSPTTPQYHDRGLGTVIGGRSDDGGVGRSSRKRQRLRRLRTWNKRFLTKSSGERALQFGLGEIDRMASALSLPEDVRKMASVIFRRAYDADVQRGRSLEAVATGAIFAAVRREGLPVTLAVLAGRSRVAERECERAYRETVRELSLAIRPPDPIEHVARIASDLDVDDDLERLARSLLEAAKEQGDHVGKHPDGLAAAALYAAGLVREADLTQAEIAAAADVSAVTIRKRYEPMLETWRRIAE